MLFALFTSIRLDKSLPSIISRRKVSKSRRSQYQGVETGDMKLAGIMSLFVSLVDQADDFITDALTSETIQPKRLSPPKQK